MDSTGALELADIPEALLVIGGGYIGLEMGTVYADLGTKVSVVELTDGLLPAPIATWSSRCTSGSKKLFDERFTSNTKVGSLGRPRRQGRSRLRRRRQVRHRAVQTACWSRRSPPEQPRLRPGKHAGRDRPTGLRRRRRAAAHGRSAHLWPSATSPANRCWPTRRRTKAESPSKRLLGEPAAFDNAGDSRRRLHRSRNRLGRSDRRASQSEGTRSRSRHVSLGGQRPGAGARAGPKVSPSGSSIPKPSASSAAASSAPAPAS